MDLKILTEIKKGNRELTIRWSESGPVGGGTLTAHARVGSAADGSNGSGAHAGGCGAGATTGEAIDDVGEGGTVGGSLSHGRACH
jgi:hypothetical protein